MGSEIIQLEDKASGSTAKVAVERGFNCFSFQATVGGNSVDVIDADPHFATGEGRPSGHGIPILFPFPNRIRAGSFQWKGESFELPSEVVGDDGASNAIHGFCLDRPWRVTAADSHFVVGEFQLSKDAPERLKCWPADCLIEIRYELRGPTLRADIKIANPSDVDLPWGFGTHPYFRLPLGAKSDVSQCVVYAPASEEWELIDCLPTGNRKPIDRSKDLREGAEFNQLKLDDVLTDLVSQEGTIETSIVDQQAGIEVTQRSEAIFGELVVYTPPDRPAVCLEPYTCVTDAINLEPKGIETGLQVLEPGEEIRTWIEISAGLVIA